MQLIDYSTSMTVQKCIGSNVSSVSGGYIDIYSYFIHIFICKSIYNYRIYLLVSFCHLKQKILPSKFINIQVVS